MQPPPLFGFVFAFYKFSRLPSVSLMERVVHAVTNSDSIHVAIIPAFKNAALETRLDSVAYTAFMGRGVEVQSVTEVMNECYTFYFVPVSGPDAFDSGLSFLHSLLGAKYNNLSLLTTLLPKRMRRAGIIPLWVSCENKGLMPRAKKPKVFCSQMGLMLCYAIDAVSNVTIDPAACSPGDLERILLAEPRCSRCALSEICSSYSSNNLY